jgi:hypothetical protein
VAFIGDDEIELSIGTRLGNIARVPPRAALGAGEIIGAFAVFLPRKISTSRMADGNAANVVDVRGAQGVEHLDLGEQATRVEYGRHGINRACSPRLAR